MKLKKIEIDTTIYAEDIISSIVFEKGIVGVQIEDNQNLTENELLEQYIDIPVINNVVETAKVSFYVKIIDNDEKINTKSNITKNIDNSYLESNDNIFTENEIENIISNLKDDFSKLKSIIKNEDFSSDEFVINDYGSLNISIIDLDNFDYLNKWKEFFEPIYIDNIIIKPSFKELSDRENLYNKIVVSIDPGGAFGTGSHETTKLCIKSIKNCINDFNNRNLDIKFLDIGCGSGILGIVAHKLGVKNTLNIDIDRSVIETVNNNLKSNNINQEFKLLIGNIIDDKNLQGELGEYDIIVANILAPIIISLLKIAHIDKFLKLNGCLILSGILKKKLDDVVKEINNNKKLKVEKIEEDGDWVCITVRKYQL